MNKKVYVINKSGHNFSKAKEYGELVFLTEGWVNKYDTSQMYRRFITIMEDSNPQDYILETSLVTMNTIAGAIFAAKHGKLNLLLFKDGDYIERNLVIDQLI